MDGKTAEKETAKRHNTKLKVPTVNYNLTTRKRLLLVKKPEPHKVGSQTHSGSTLRSSLQLRKEPALKVGYKLSRRTREAVPEQRKRLQSKGECNTIQSHCNESKRIEVPLPKLQERTAGTNDMTDGLNSSLLEAMTLQHLQTQMHRWFIKTGKCSRMFFYLSTYNPPSGENKENVEVEVLPRSFSDLEISTKETESKLHFLDVYALLAMLDLKKIISEGFSVEYGIQWLELIESNHENLLESPTFWIYKGEVLEASGKVLLAVQCYKMAITFGAKRKQVNRRLDGILDRFSVAMMNLKKKPPGKNVSKHQIQMIDEVKEIFRKAVDIFS